MSYRTDSELTVLTTKTISRLPHLMVVAALMVGTALVLAPLLMRIA